MHVEVEHVPGRVTFTLHPDAGDEAARVRLARRTAHFLVDVPPGSRVEVVRGARPVKWVRLDDSPFTDRLVTKFELPVTGWRGRSAVRPLT